MQLAVPGIGQKTRVDFLYFGQRLLDFALPYQILDLVPLLYDVLVHFGH